MLNRKSRNVGEALDEEMESGDEFESGQINTNTGAYDDDEEVEDIVDIVSQDDESKSKKTTSKKSKKDTKQSQLGEEDKLDNEQPTTI